MKRGVDSSGRIEVETEGRAEEGRGIGGSRYDGRDEGMKGEVRLSSL